MVIESTGLSFGSIISSSQDGPGDGIEASSVRTSSSGPLGTFSTPQGSAGDSGGIGLGDGGGDRGVTVTPGLLDGHGQSTEGGGQDESELDGWDRIRKIR